MSAAEYAPRGMRILGVALALALFAEPARAAEPKLVVVDPGHGGRKSGTRTGEGVSEASIVLGIAREVRERLAAEGYRVVLTRDEDKDIDLDDRIALANGAKAAVFVSVHCNYAPLPERRGVETYILSAQASDELTAQLAALENEGEGGAKSKEEEGAGDLDFILQDLQRMTAHKDSALLARLVQDSVGVVRGLIPSRGLRQAPFKVLRGANMPAVLVEVGYLSNPAQGALLSSSKGQRSAGEAIARGVKRFFQELQAQER